MKIKGQIAEAAVSLLGPGTPMCGCPPNCLGDDIAIDGVQLLKVDRGCFRRFAEGPEVAASSVWACEKRRFSN